MKVFGFFGFLSSYMRCMYYACVCACVVVNTGTQWFHIFSRMCVGGLSIPCFVCMHFRDFSQHQLTLEGLNSSFPFLIKQNKSTGRPLYFVVRELFHLLVFFELKHGCNRDTIVVWQEFVSSVSLCTFMLGINAFTCVKVANLQWREILCYK